MNPLSFLKRNKETAQNPVNNQPKEEDYDDDSEINIGTKVKIVSAMLVVAVATYVALWVQEPADMKIDVISGTTIADETVKESEPMVRETTMVAATDTAYPVLAEVAITDFTFTPANMTVKKGTTVVWTNMDPVDHTVTADTFSSSTIEAGDSYTYTFDAAGEYLYSCAFHPQMTGKIIVTDEAAETDEMMVTTSTVSEPPRDLEDLYPALSTTDTLDQETAVGTDLLSVTTDTVALNDLDEPPAETPLMVTFNAEDLLASGAVREEMSAAIQESDKLTKSGPEDVLYVFAFAAILYFNRRKIAGVLS